MICPQTQCILKNKSIPKLLFTMFKIVSLIVYHSKFLKLKTEASLFRTLVAGGTIRSFHRFERTFHIIKTVKIKRRDR